MAGETVVLDCITLWLTNIFHDNEFDVEISLKYAKNQWQQFINQDFKLIIVSNELGMGVHPINEAARKFANLQGWMNQYIAEASDEAYLMVSGLPMKVK